MPSSPGKELYEHKHPARNRGQGSPEFERELFAPMKKTVDEINKMIMERCPMEKITMPSFLY